MGLRPGIEDAVRGPVVEVRRAGPTDLEALLALWEQLVEAADAVVRPLLGRLDPTRTITGILAGNSAQIYVALSADGEVIGGALLRRGRLAEDLGMPVTELAALIVDKAHRSHGAGSSLLRAVADVADRQGLTHLSVNVPARDRAVNRFLARRGFAPILTRRLAPIAALQRALAPVDRIAARRRIPGLRPR